MALSVIVCVKPVPSANNATIDPVTKVVRRENVESMINPLDKNALAVAARLKKDVGADITVLSMAPPSAEAPLREALARGGDRVILLSDRAFAGGDTFATSYVLSQGIKKLGRFDLILAGDNSTDGGTAQLPAQLAEWLGIPHLHNAVELAMEGRSLHAVAETDGVRCTWEGRLPMLVSVSREINTPKAVGIREILAAKRKKYTVWSSADLPEADAAFLGLAGSPTQFGELHPIEGDRSCQIVSGTADEIAAGILSTLGSAGVRL